MAVYDETQLLCLGCNRYVLARRKGTNHVLHLLLTLATCSAWGIVWVIALFNKGEWRCPTCGSEL